MARHELFRDGVLVYSFDGPAHHQLLRDGVAVYDFNEAPPVQNQRHELRRDGVTVYDHTGPAHHVMNRDGAAVYDYNDTGGGGTPGGGYTGEIHWHLGAPGEVSPSSTIKNVYAEEQYAAEVTKVNEGTTLRIQAANSGPWFQYVKNEIPGVRGEETAIQMGGSADIPLRGAPDGPGLVVLIKVTSFPDGGPVMGTIAPQVIST